MDEKNRGTNPGGQGQPSTSRPGTSDNYKYRGGRQGQGGVPNPDDADDDKSAGSFRGRADEGAEASETPEQSPNDEVDSLKR